MNNQVKNHIRLTLSKLQNDFQAYLLNSNPNSITNTAFTKQIINDKKVGVNTRLGIYYKAYRLRMIEALANTYPILKALLGDDLFDKTARSYIDFYPSTHRNMRWVGDQMCTHITKTLALYPIANEMATFEWALSLAFDVRDAPILSMQDLASIAPENWPQLQFKFHPSVQVIEFKYNVLQVWQALNNEETPPKITQINEPCLVWRKDLNSHFRSLDLAEFLAIKTVIAGASFGELCEKCQENAVKKHATDNAVNKDSLENQAAEQAAQFILAWLENGVLIHP